MGLVRPIRPPFTYVNGQPTLNQQHPLSRGMTDCLLWNSLVPRNLALPTVQTTLTSSPTLVPTRLGYAGYATGGTAFNIPNHGNICAGAFSFRLIVRIVSWPANFTALVDKGIPGSRELSLFFDTNGQIDFISLGAGVGATGTIVCGMTAGGIYDLVITRSAALTSANFYVNGALTATPSTAAVLGTTAVATPLPFGSNPSTGGVNADAQYITSQIWNRDLSAGEVLQLARDPYCFLNYPQDVVSRAVSRLLYLRPDADSIDGGWTNELGGTSLFASVDESLVNDSDYIQSSINPVADVAKISLSDPVTGVGAPSKIRYRYKKDSTTAANLTVRLLQGVTEIASWTHTGISSSYVTTEQTLTAPQLASITDFTDLYIVFEANT